MGFGFFVVIIPCNLTSANRPSITPIDPMCFVYSSIWNVMRNFACTIENIENDFLTATAAKPLEYTHVTTKVLAQIQSPLDFL